MQKCPNCQTANADQYKFCNNCGMPLGKPPAPMMIDVTPTVPPPPTAPSPPKPLDAPVPSTEPILVRIATERPTQVEVVQPTVIKVAITNFNMPFLSMVRFFIKLALASIPAAILILIIFAVLIGIFGDAISALLFPR